MESRLRWSVLMPLLATLVACGHGTPARSGTNDAVAVVDQQLATLAVGAQGYKCDGSDTYRACACAQREAGAWTCKGMTKMCKDIGAGTPNCKLGVCSCEWTR